MITVVQPASTSSFSRCVSRWLRAELCRRRGGDALLALRDRIPTLDKMYAARNGSTLNCSWACSDSLSSCASGLHEKLDAALSLEVRAIGCAGMTRGGVCDVGGLPGVGLSAIHGPLFVNSEAVHAAGHRPRMKCSAQVIFGATLEPT